jgi:hypothetical protein
VVETIPHAASTGKDLLRSHNSGPCICMQDCKDKSYKAPFMQFKTYLHALHKFCVKQSLATCLQLGL